MHIIMYVRQIARSAVFGMDIREGFIGTVVEATAGNTGIGLAHICNVRGYACVFYMPDNQSPEKIDILRTFGADVRVVKTVPYRDEMNYQKQAGRYAASLDGAIWSNQFDNVAR